MKFLILALALTFSGTSFARQYIQCSELDINSTEVMVVNLPTEKGGTLFLSSGMQNPEDERLLVDIQLEKIENDHHLFKVVTEGRQGQITVPSEVIGKAAKSFNIQLVFAGFHLEYGCFSSLYND
jgi:hypothetical protein